MQQKSGQKKSFIFCIRNGSGLNPPNFTCKLVIGSERVNKPSSK